LKLYRKYRTTAKANFKTLQFFKREDEDFFVFPFSLLKNCRVWSFDQRDQDR
jgi:hypothetical protein